MCFLKFYELIVPLQLESGFWGFYRVCLNGIHTQVHSSRPRTRSHLGIYELNSGEWQGR